MHMAKPVAHPTIIKEQDLATRLTVILKSLKPYERVEISLQDELVGNFVILVTSKYKQVFTLE